MKYKVNIHFYFKKKYINTLKNKWNVYSAVMINAI